MKWSWSIGRLAGVDTQIHASFLLLVAWAAWAAWSGAGTTIAVLWGIAFLVAVFGSVLLHELGHALVARRYGIETRRIVLLPIGGLAQLEGEPANPREEMAIALAGPAVNFVLAAVLFVLGTIVGSKAGYGLLDALTLANLSLGVFNLLPAFPMDGGRALRAFLATRVGGRRATDIAVAVGKAAALVVGFIGLFTNFMLVIVAAFVWFAARAESRRGAFVYGGDPYDWSDPYVRDRFWSRPDAAWSTGRWSRTVLHVDRDSDLASTPGFLERIYMEQRHGRPVRVVILYGRRYLVV